MSEVLQFLIRHGYAVLFCFVFLEQTGLPIASVPVLLGIGALSADGRFSIAAALGLTLLASLSADMVWYELGRRRGYGVLRVLCRISIEPDTCVKRTTRTFQRHGSRTLVIAKFVPGLGAVTTPMAGLLRMPPAQFLLLDGLGVTLWAGLYLGLGFLFRSQLEQVAAIISRTGTSLALIAALLTGSYFAWKWRARRRYLRMLDTARILPEELLRRMEAGETMVILDMRHSGGPDGARLPGALRFPPEELDQRHEEIPRDRDIVLYCS
jgi:membrane protein DedA with SNARE-associated domain